MTDDDLELFSHLVQELQTKEQQEPVISPREPEELLNALPISLNSEPLSETDFENAIKDIVMNSPRTATNHFFNQLFGGRKSKAVLGDLLGSVLNNGMHIYKVNGVQVLIEREIINTINTMIHYPETASGIFTPGGSMSNFMALLMARDSYDLTIKKYGVTKKMVIYTSDQSHYSMVKNIRFAGLGEDSLRKIPSDTTGKMDVTLLEEAIKNDLASGYHPFFVKATAGTTVLGTFDPIDTIADICSKYGIWLHVDGALGGSTIFSEQYKHLLKGIERSDSFALNAHKMLGTPISCSMIFVKDKKYLYDSFNSQADYLYQGDINDTNPGMISLQCARTNDSLKLWTLWKSVGTKGLENIVNKNFELAEVARSYIRNNSDYTLHNDETSTNICFNYKNYSAVEVCRNLHLTGTLLVSHGSFRNETFIRLVTINSNNSPKDILNFFTTLEKFIEK